MRFNYLHYIKSRSNYQTQGGLTSSSFAYRKVVCWLSSLTLCPDVHCPVAVNREAVSDNRALFIAEGQS